jgi:hypothetical protein
VREPPEEASSSDTQQAKTKNKGEAMSRCRQFKTGASAGDYQLKVTSNDENVTVQGTHGINGEPQEQWDNDVLLNKSQKFTVQDTERHQTIVIATFAPSAAEAAAVTVQILRDGKDVMPACQLTPRGNTISVMSVLPIAE